ncbi:hypothetical protein CA831_03980 [Burkholderia multivorans]|uniref:Uncharacterized protein n=1 Tax=Burkholderia aenigmatica TaxID=2015348 RepID=A0A228I002_9BURK|nr:hypothetical protein CA831_03980 [Burkholderia multivorans]OXI35389.1 hypothetical protein CFB84_37590 [Burkholderia aenigmatica]
MRRPMTVVLRTLIPAAWFHEPKWTPDDMSPKRRCIGFAIGEHFAIADTWPTWPEHSDNLVYAITMITGTPISTASQ